MSEKSDAANDHLRQLVSELALCLHRLLGSCSHDGHHHVGLTNKLGSAKLARAGRRSAFSRTTARKIKSVLISSALGNDQSDIVVLFTGAKLFKSIDNSRYHHLWR